MSVISRTAFTLFAGLVLAAAPAAQAEQAPERVASEADFTFEAQQGPWLTTQQATLRFMLDRPAGKLRVEHPGATVVVADGKLTATVTNAEGYAIERPIAALDYQTLAQAVPAVGEPAMVNLAMLLADDPATAIAGGSASFQSSSDGVRSLATPQGQWSIDLGDGELAESATFEFAGGGNGQAVPTFTYQWDLDANPDAFAEDAFVLDTTGRQTVDSFQALVQAMQGGGMAGPGSGGGDPIVGSVAPDFTLERLDADESVTLSEIDSDVVVLDFWATWCPPCVKGLPEVQAVADWAEQQNLSVSVYAVNLEEQPGQIRGFMSNHGLDLPVLLDTRGRTAEAYQVQGIPTTVVIADGKIANYHRGLAPNLQSTLKSEIEIALASP